MYKNAYQMIIRMCIRAPMNLICALAMAMMINFKLSMIFVVAIVFLSSCACNNYVSCYKNTLMMFFLNMIL